MDVIARFSAARDVWMSRYIGVLQDYLRTYQPGGPEVLLERSKDGSLRPFRLYRMDLASGSVTPPNFTDVNVDEMPTFAPETVTLPSGLILTIKPFHWNGVDFTVRGLGQNYSQLAAWCLKWIDEPESGTLDAHGLLGAIHSVTAPEVGALGVCFSVDFGSAPVEAVQSLFDLLSSMGASTVTIESTTDDET